MNAGDSLFRFGDYHVFPTANNLFNIYHVIGLEAELMIADFLSLADAIKYLKNA